MKQKAPRAWHVVHGDTYPRYEGEPDDPEPECKDDADPWARNWTVSPDPTKSGWQTDSGCWSYGLTKPEAEELVAGTRVLAAVRQAIEKSSHLHLCTCRECAVLRSLGAVARGEQ